MRKISAKELDRIRGTDSKPKKVEKPKIVSTPPPKVAVVPKVKKTKATKDYSKDIADSVLISAQAAVESVKAGAKKSEELKKTIENGFSSLTKRMDIVISKDKKKDKMNLTFDILRDSDKLISQVLVKEA